MKKLIFFLLPFLLINLHSQTPNLGWAKSMGGDSTDQPYSIAVDDASNIYTTGRFTGSADFDPGPTSYTLSGGGAFISKLDANGNFVWAKQFAGMVYSFSVANDKNGNILIAGIFKGKVDFDPGSSTFFLTSNEYNNSFIIKLSSEGNLLWAKQITGTEGENISGSIVLDAENNAYIFGNYYASADFDPGAGTAIHEDNNEGDLFILKLNSSGDFVWVKLLEGNSQVNPSKIAITKNGDLYITGTYTGTKNGEFIDGYIDFDPGIGTYFLTAPKGFTNTFISKLSSNGVFFWAKQLSGISPYSMKADVAGNVIITGYFWDTQDFDPGTGKVNLTSNGAEDIFVLKLDAGGKYLWARGIGGSYTDIGMGVDMDAGNNIYVSGNFVYTVDFDPGQGEFMLTSESDYQDVFLLKLYADGNLDWVQHSIKGIYRKFNKALTVDKNGEIYTIGYFEKTADFDPGIGITELQSKGEFDIFIQKVEQRTVGVDEYEGIAGNMFSFQLTDGSIILTNFFESDQSPVEVTIYSTTGEIINKYSEQPKRYISIDTTQWISGIYLIHLQSGTESKTFQVPVVH